MKRKSNPEVFKPRDLTHCSHKLKSTVTTDPIRLILIMIITRHFQFHLVNVSILQSKYEYDAQSESRFACYSHCSITWCTLMTGIVASHASRQAHDALHDPFNTSMFKSVRKNSATIKHIYNEFAKITEGYNNAFDTNDYWNFL